MKFNSIPEPLPTMLPPALDASLLIDPPQGATEPGYTPPGKQSAWLEIVDVDMKFVPVDGENPCWGYFKKPSI